MIDIVPWIILIFIAWFWLDSLSARENANTICNTFCERQGVKFLDGTVAARSIRLKRNSQGRINLRRIYHFEYSNTGETRHEGIIIMLGNQIEAFHLAAKE
ncbi:MAG: DUF3301 domain-containing protein [Gammaproteobacteria bacterium]|nr:DUF3301 domain-containing protein [Gammaproteobacteria bacterium]